MKRIVVVMMVLCLSIPFVPIAAAAEEGSFKTKDEVIYATLKPNGDQEGMYVVNSFEIEDQGEITDYGDYDEIKNLSNLEEIEQNENKVSFTASEDEFYYQGDLNNKKLPWSFAVSYQMDGEEMSPDELLGKEGHVTIELDVSSNEGVDTTFYENYLLQISMELESNIFENIEAEAGSIANSGKNNQVTFTVMPEQEKQFKLEADVKDFEFEGININAVPSSMDMETPDVDNMKEDMNTLSDATREIDDGVGEFQQGISDLNSGIRSLENGSAEYKNGLKELNNGSAGLINGSQQIKEALELMNSSLNQEVEMGDFSSLQKGLTQIANGLQETGGGLTSLNENYQKAYEALDQSINAIPDHQVSEEEIQALYQVISNSDADPQTVDQLVETYQATQKTKGTYNQVKQAFDMVSPTLTEVDGSLSEMATNLGTTAEELASAMKESDIQSSINELQAGVSELTNQYENFHAGLKEYTNGVGELTNSYGEIHNGIGELSEGSSSLEDGVHELKEGTSELADSTSDLPKEVQNEVDEMMNEYDKSDFESVSFVSGKNEKVENVQFVIKTNSITKEEEEKKEEEQVKEKGFWEKLLDLFK